MAQLKSYQQISPNVCPAAVFSRLVAANRTNVNHLTISAFINMFSGNLIITQLAVNEKRLHVVGKGKGCTEKLMACSGELVR